MRDRRVVGIGLVVSALILLGAAVLKPSDALVSAGQNNNISIASASLSQVSASSIPSGTLGSFYQPLILQPAGVQALPSQIGAAAKAPSGSPIGVLPCVSVPGITDKCPAWVSTYDGPAHGYDGQYGFTTRGRSTVTSPDGHVVYLMAITQVGTKSNGSPQYDEIVIAFDTATGQQLWTSIYGGTADLPNPVPEAMAVSSDGSRVFTTSYVVSDNGGTTASATVAFDASTGAQLWSATIPLALGNDIAISPDGVKVYMTGYIPGRNPDGTPFVHALTISYDAASGQELWRSEYAASSPNQALGFRTAVKPDGTVLYVAGSEAMPGQLPFEVMLLVYDTQTGALLHEAHHAADPNSTSGNTLNAPSGIAVSDSGVFVAETLTLTSLFYQIALTVGYDSKGNELWSSQFGNGAGCNGTPFPCDNYVNYDGPIATSPDGSRVFVTMESSNGSDGFTGFATVAYDTATGETKWAVRDEKGKVFCIGCNGPVVQINPDGQEVYVTGLADFNSVTEDITTVAYDTATGAQKWTTFSPGYQFANSFGIAVNPNGSRVFVAGVTAAIHSDSDLITLAYDTGVPPPVQLRSVVSRKVHGSAGPFGIDLPLHSRGIECRSGGANRDYTLVFTFANTLASVGGASVTSGTGSVASSNIDSNDAHNYIVNLTGVTNAQYIRVSLSNVTDSGGNFSSAISVSMGVLIGDVNASGVVTSGDTNLCKAQALQPVTTANFRNDINASGAITTGDVNLIKQNALTQLPTPP
jgi:hypothetical protein